jgi:hypothetical protein
MQEKDVERWKAKSTERHVYEEGFGGGEKTSENGQRDVTV